MLPGATSSSIAGLLYRFGVQHPWLELASGFCWQALERAIPGEAHALLSVLLFLEHVPDRARAEALVPAVAARLPSAAYFRADAASPEYGVTPLHVAPTPVGRWRALFDDATISAHLDRLQADQQPDGGWPLTWQPPGQASTLEWRGAETLRALHTLTAYGRLRVRK